MLSTSISRAVQRSVRATFAETDPRRLLTGFAHICRELLDRSAPAQRVLRGAATVDPEAAELLALVNSQRLEGQSRIAHALAVRGALTKDVTEATAADTIYALMAPEMHHILTVERAWSADRYERWLAHALCALLLPPLTTEVTLTGAALNRRPIGIFTGPEECPYSLL